jgi:cold shock CspA family protein
MRFTGKIHTWHAARGFGFIRPTNGGQDIYVHISNLPRGRADRDELLSFEVSLNRDGKKKAVNVCPAVAEPAPAPAARTTPRPTARREQIVRGSGRWTVGMLLRVTVLACALVAAGWFGLQHLTGNMPDRSPAPAARVASPATSPTAPTPSPVSSFRCDGRQLCSQMTSCKEATWFLQNCPATQMDGNGDGVPCEMQWCK